MTASPAFLSGPHIFSDIPYQLFIQLCQSQTYLLYVTRAHTTVS